MQLNQAQSEEELQKIIIVADETAINFFQECGITTSVSVSNHSNTKLCLIHVFVFKMVTKLTVAHCIMAYEAVYRIKPLLEQISEGLNIVGAL